jgi:hypothetical protein
MISDPVPDLLSHVENIFRTRLRALLLHCEYGYILEELTLLEALKAFLSEKASNNAIPSCDRPEQPIVGYRHNIRRSMI